ncbi:MAG: carboxypeptidase-like regulatory domain-containing protein [Bacteroidales bacterium]|nr:carboxypeptidase-like regulatory domain-containing protein [Bacteroidales bacterium]
MKKIVSISALIIIGSVTYCQVIKGTIFDSETKTTIPYAAIYFTGTLVGTASDQDGIFELDITKYASKPLTIRAMGYEPFTLKAIPADEQYTIYLIPSSFEIEEVSVSTKSLVRRRQAHLRLFRREFLGTTGNERECKILNENDITFNYGSDKDTVKAYASKPIVVYNGALGYVITYYLDEFEYDKDRHVVTFTGDIVFNEDLAIKDRNNQSYSKKRELAYYGSCMHFFRALWANNLKATGFVIIHSSNNQLTDSYKYATGADKFIKYKDIVIQDNKNNQYLMYSDNLQIFYMAQSSNMIFLKSKVLFEQNGFFEPSAIRWEGDMAEQRVADMLPYEYLSEK